MKNKKNKIQQLQKEINILERLPYILKKIKSIKTVLILNYPGKKYLNHNKLIHNYLFSINYFNLHKTNIQVLPFL